MGRYKNNRALEILNLVIDNKNITFKEIGEKLGVSRQRAKQLCDAYQITGFTKSKSHKIKKRVVKNPYQKSEKQKQKEQRRKEQIERARKSRA